MSKKTIITIGLNSRQFEVLKDLDSLYGETGDERVLTILMLWMHDNVPSLIGVGDE